MTMMAKQRFFVVTGSLDKKRAKDGVQHFDSRCVPEMPQSGPADNYTQEHFNADVAAWLAACNATQKAKKIVGTVPIGDPPIEQDVELPLKSANGRPYDVAVTPWQARGMFLQSIRQRHSSGINQDLNDQYGVAPKGTKKVKGFVIPA